MRYEIQTLFANGEWQNPDGETYGSKAEAEAELQEVAHKYGGLYFVSGYCFSDFNAEDWRVRGYDDYDGPDLDDSYQIYIACMHGTGQPVKAYDEWLQS